MAESMERKKIEVGNPEALGGKIVDQGRDILHSRSAHPPIRQSSEGLFHQHELRFDGSTYEPKHDAKRLGRLLDAVFHQLYWGEWFTLRELAKRCRGSEPSVSARLRDLRKQRYGGWIIERRRQPGLEAKGIFQYRLRR